MYYVLIHQTRQGQKVEGQDHKVKWKYNINVKKLSVLNSLQRRHGLNHTTKSAKINKGAL